MNLDKHDTGDDIQMGNAAWNFTEAANNFDAHVRRSIPLYDLGHESVAQYASFFLRNGATAYEIGCSTGRLAQRILEHNPEKNVKYIAIDNVPAMVSRATERLKDDVRAQVEEADAVTYPYGSCCLFVSYYTIQFINPCVRQDLIDKIYNALDWGGAAIIYEKVRGPDARFQDLLTQLYTDYKLAQGFSESEIVHKTRSLKGVLEPFSTAGNIDLLRRAGFVDIMTIHKHLCFEGYLCIK